MNKKANVLMLGAGVGLGIGLEGQVNELSADWKKFTITQYDLENYNSSIPLYLTKLKPRDEIFYNLDTKKVVLRSQGDANTDKDIAALPGTEGQPNADQLFNAFINSTDVVKTEMIDGGNVIQKQQINKDSGSSSTDNEFATRVIISANGSYLLQNVQDRVIGPVRQKIDEDGFKGNTRLDVKSAPFVGPFGIDAAILFNFLWTTYHNNCTISGENAPGASGAEVGGRNNQMLEGKIGLPTFNAGNGRYFLHIVPFGYLTHFERNSQEFLSTIKRVGKDDYQGLWLGLDLVGKHFDDGRLVGLEYQLIFGEKGTPQGPGKTAVGDGHRLILYAGTPKIEALRTMFDSSYELTGRHVNYGTSANSAKEYEQQQKFTLGGKTDVGKGLYIIYNYSMTDWDPKTFDLNMGVQFNISGDNPDFYNKPGSRRR